MTPGYTGPDPLDNEAVRQHDRKYLLSRAETMNSVLTQYYEGELKNWKGLADRAAGEGKPTPPKPAPPARWVVPPDDGTWASNALFRGTPIEFKDVQVTEPYKTGYFGPAHNNGKVQFLYKNDLGEAIYSGHPGDIYPNGNIVVTADGTFRKVVAGLGAMFNVNGGGYWVKVSG